MKKVETLVEDIYNLFTLDPIDMNEEEVDKHIDTFGEMIKIHIKEFLYDKPRDRATLRLSTIGKPDRQLWYDLNEPLEDVQLQPSTRIKFLYGYILEELLLLCTAIAGHAVTDQQKEVEVAGVKGHQDSMIDGVLVDCKSASGPGFDKFRYNKLVEDDPFGYLAQISAYAHANGVDRAAFLVINKSTGEICLTPVQQMDMINAKNRVEYLKGMVTDSHIPDRCYDPVPDGKSGNYKLSVGCIYCGHKRECWKEVNHGQGIRVFKYAKGKRFLTQIGKEPDVEEIFNW